MASPQRFTDAAKVSALRERQAPPLIPEVLSGDTRLTGRWRKYPFEAHIPSMSRHVLAAKYAGEGHTTAKLGRIVSRYPSLAGTVMVFPSGYEGHFHVDGGSVVSSIHLGRQRLRACAEEVGCGREPELVLRESTGDPKLFGIMALLCEEAGPSETLSRLFIEQLLDLLCMQLLRRHCAAEVRISEPRRGLANWQVKRVTDYMRENISADIELPDLAGLVGLGHFHFCTAFRMATGRTPHEWLTGERMARARALLRDPLLRIYDVALAVGYQTPSAFAATFRKTTGETPTAFRRGL